MQFTVDQLKEALGGRELRPGRHRGKPIHHPELELSAHEALSLAMHNAGKLDLDEATDDPLILRTWDYSAINDLELPDDVRTGVMLPIVAAYSGMLDEPAMKQMRILRRLARRTIREIVADEDFFFRSDKDLEARYGGYGPRLMSQMRQIESAHAEGRSVHQRGLEIETARAMEFLQRRIVETTTDLGELSVRQWKNYGRPPVALLHEWAAAWEHALPKEGEP